MYAFPLDYIRLRKSTWIEYKQPATMHEECDEDLNQDEQEVYDDGYPGTDEEDDNDLPEVKKRKAQQKQFDDQRIRAAAAATATEIVPVNSKKRKTAMGVFNSFEKGRRLDMPSKSTEDKPASILQHSSKPDADEVYSDQEKALSEFLKLHPMLSLASLRTFEPTAPPRAP
jgi:hypothetical protein